MLLLTNKTIDKLQYDLVREGFVDLDGLNLAQEAARKNSTNLSVELVRENLITEKILLNFIQDKLHIPYVELSDYAPDKNCLSYIDADDAQKYNIFPLFKIEDVLTIAMSDPLDLFAINNIFGLEGLSIEPVVCSEISIKAAIQKYYFSESMQMENVSWQEHLIAGEFDDSVLCEIISDVLKDGIKNNVKKIVLEKFENGLNVFFENERKGFVPNLLVQRFLYELGNSFANIDLLEDTISQTARFDFFFEEQEYSVFLSKFLAKSGVMITLLLNKPLDEIPEKLQNKINIMLEKPVFIGLVGNDIKEFLYSLAQYIAQKKRVLIVESFSKYKLEKVSQFETKENVGVYFSDILKQIELQDFDVVFFEKIYTKEQFAALKFFAKERVIITTFVAEEDVTFDFLISSDGVIS